MSNALSGSVLAIHAFVVNCKTSAGIESASWMHFFPSSVMMIVGLPIFSSICERSFCSIRTSINWVACDFFQALSNPNSANRSSLSPTTALLAVPAKC